MQEYKTETATAQISKGAALKTVHFPKYCFFYFLEVSRFSLCVLPFLFCDLASWSQGTQLCSHGNTKTQSVIISITLKQMNECLLF